MKSIVLICGLLVTATPCFAGDLVKAEVVKAARQHHVPVKVAKAVVFKESSFKCHAVSSVGAYGPGQLMPGTAKDLGVNRYDCKDNIRGAMIYLAKLIKKYGMGCTALSGYERGIFAKPRCTTYGKAVTRLAQANL